MTLLVYPTLPGLTFPVLRSMEWDTLINTSPNKYEVRLPQTSNPLWSWQLIYNYLHDYPFGSFTVSAFKTLLDFYMFQQGQAGAFLFHDASDNSVGPALVPISLVPNVPMAQLPLVTDGLGNFFSPLQRTFGGLAYEDITDLDTSVATGSTPTFYANGVLQATPANYTIQGPGLSIPGASYMGLYLAWVGTPVGPITGQFNFYFRARFETDMQDMEEFVSNIWTIGGEEARNGSGFVKLTQVRPNPL